MRHAVCQALVDLHERHDFAFLTGDLGFMVLEPLRTAIGDHFFNAGVAEQNMISVAAGLSRSGVQAWVYSIAPFTYARPFEQIRNDVCLHNADVKLIGNGGGYGYGSMGPSHHAIEDYGVISALQNMHVFVPAFAEDVAPVVALMASLKGPAYLRLGKCEKPEGVDLPTYSGWRRLSEGDGPLILVVGPLAGGLLNMLKLMPYEKRAELWVLTELPITLNSAPSEFIAKLERTRRLNVVEEHIAHGGVGQMVAHELMLNGIPCDTFTHFYAKGYPSGRYGSQSFHRRESGLDPQQIINSIYSLQAN